MELNFPGDVEHLHNTHIAKGYSVMISKECLKTGTFQILFLINHKIKML